MIIRRTRAASTALIASAVLVASAAVAAPTTAGAATGTARTYVAKPMCAKAAPGHLRCYAMRLVPAAKGTFGARTMRAPSYRTGPAGGYTPRNLATAYGVNPDAPASAGMVVAIVDAYNNPHLRADLNKFDAKYGLPAETNSSLRIVNQSGARSPLPAGNKGWGGEEALDVQAVRGLCHKCRIVLVEANNAMRGNLAIAVKTAVHTFGAKIVSNSYGAPESASTASYQAAYNQPGVAMIASTGDDGWYDWDNANLPKGHPSHEAAIPAAYGSVVAVGGTSLYLNSDGTRAAEQVWNSNGPANYYGFGMGTTGASGGGCSKRFAARPWQSAASGYAALGCAAGKRSTADIAAVADSFTGYDVYNSYGSSSPWATIGGTSLAAPVIAAMWALAGGPGAMTNPVKTLYDHYSTDTVSPFYDVTVGGNGFCGTSNPTACDQFYGQNPNKLGAGVVDCAFTSTGAFRSNITQCNAAVGFDGPSGVGTPIGVDGFIPKA